MGVVRRLCGPVFVLAGTLHFVLPKPYLAIMPPWLPRHRELVAASGVAEIAGGLALMAPSPAVRRAGGWWTILTLIGVFPANVQMALNPEDHRRIPAPLLWARLPLQGVLIAWAVSAMRRE